MDFRELTVPHAYHVVPAVYPDDRGLFLEVFRQPALAAATGRRLPVEQVNCSVSRRGVIRGVHAAAVPPSQAKYVTCLSGAVIDVVVDLRVGSPAFGRFDTVRLDAEQRSAVFVPEGLGHAFLALTDHATVAYLCSTGYSPEREFGVNPRDPRIGIDWAALLDGSTDDLVLSPKDRDAPDLAQAQDRGLLPTYADCLAWYAKLADDC